MYIFCDWNGGKVLKSVGFSRGLRCWCADGGSLSNSVRHDLEKVNHVIIDIDK